MLYRLWVIGTVQQNQIGDFHTEAGAQLAARALHLSAGQYRIEVVPKPESPPDVALQAWKALWDQAQAFLPDAKLQEDHPIYDRPGTTYAMRSRTADFRGPFGWWGRVHYPTLGSFEIVVNGEGRGWINYGDAKWSPSKAMRIFRILLEPDEE